MWSSFVHDYVARQKLSGTHMTYGVVNQLACPPPEAFREPLSGVSGTAYRDWVRARVLEF